MSELKKFIEMSFLEDMTKEEINAVLNKQHAEITRLKGELAELKPWGDSTPNVDKQGANLASQISMARKIKSQEKEINKYLNRIQNLKAELEQATRWRDIESAPRDGTRILLYWEGHNYIGFGFCESDRFFRNTKLEPLETPTAWKPLPPAPNGDE